MIFADLVPNKNMAKSVIKLKPIVGQLKPIMRTTYYTDIDTLIDEVFDGTGTQFAMIDNHGNITNAPMGNRQQIFGWANESNSKLYCQLLIISFRGFYSAIRFNATTSTITQL